MVHSEGLVLMLLILHSILAILLHQNHHLVHFLDKLRHRLQKKSFLLELMVVQKMNHFLG
tara:strand:- start:527 stop:706 length:180 start_codon:yes stop_codon:yes gene_type:complete